MGNKKSINIQKGRPADVEAATGSNDSSERSSSRTSKDVCQVTIADESTGHKTTTSATQDVSTSSATPTHVQSQIRSPGNDAISDTSKSEDKFTKVLDLLKVESSSSAFKAEVDKLIRKQEISATHQICGKSLVHHIVALLEHEHVGVALAKGLDPWSVNEDDGKLALHAALEKGNHLMCQNLLKYMDKKIDPSKRMTLQHFSLDLIKKVIANDIAVEKRKCHVNHVKCLEVLLADKILSKEVKNVNLNDNESKASRTLTKTDGEFKRVVEEISQVKILERAKGHTTLRVAVIEDILKTDNRDLLESTFCDTAFEIQQCLQIDGAAHGRTIFHLIVENCSIKCLKFILNKTRDHRMLSVPDKWGKTPLHYASLDENNPKKILAEALIESGAYLLAKDNFGNGLDKSIIKAYYCDQSIKVEDEIIESLLTEDSGEVKKLIKKLRGSEIVVRNFAGSKTVLYRCTQMLQNEEVNTLLEMGYDPWIQNTDDGHLPLHAALARGHASITVMLLNKMRERAGCKYFLDLQNWSFSLFQKVICNYTALVSEANPEINYLECLKVLLDNSIILDIHHRTKYEMMPADLTQYLNLAEVEELLQRRYSFSSKHVVEEILLGSWSELEKILKRDDADDLEIYLARCANIMERIIRPKGVPSNNTIFHAAIDLKAYNCLDLLCRKSPANLINLPDGKGKTPLHKVVELESYINWDVIFLMGRILLKNGARLFSRDCLGNTPLHSLVIKSLNNKFKHNYLLRYFDLFLQFPLDKHAKNYCCVSALDLLSLPQATEGTKNLAKKILDKLNAVQNSDNNFETELLNRICEGNHDATELHISNNVSQVVKHSLDLYVGNKPLLYHVTSHLSLKCLEQVLESGANPWLPCIGSNKFCLHSALEQGSVTATKMLINGMKNSPRLPFIETAAYDYSFLQKVICNSRTMKKLETDINHNKCLELLLNSSLIGDVNQRKNYLDQTTVLDLANCCSVKTGIARQLSAAGAVSPSNYDRERKPVSWSKMETILRADNREALEFELTLRNNLLHEILQPPGLPKTTTILHEALNLEAYDCLEYLVSCRSSTADLDTPDRNGNTVLHLISKQCQKHCNIKLISILKYVILSGANINSRNNIGDTPLHVFLRQENASIECAKLMSVAEAQLQSLNDKLETSTDNVSKTSKDAAEKITSTLPSSANDTFNVVNCSIMLQLFDAIRMTQKVEVIDNFQKLYHRDNSFLNNKYLGSKSLLYCLIEFLEVEHIYDIIQAGSNPWIRNMGEARMLPLHAALSRGHLPIVHALIESMKVSSRSKTVKLNEDTSSLLEKVICNFNSEDNPKESNHAMCLKRLLEPDVNLDLNATCSVRKITVTPITLARKVKFRRGEKLLQSAGFKDDRQQANTNELSELKITPKLVRDILRDDHLSALQLLITNYKGNPETILRPDGNNTLLHSAIESEARECFSFLLRIAKNTLDEPNQQGGTPLHAAVTKCCSKSSIFGLWSAKMLLVNGACPNSRNNDGESPLHLVAGSSDRHTDHANKRSYLKPLELLIQSDHIDVDAINKSMQTPLIHLLDKIKPNNDLAREIVQTLIQNGASTSDVSTEILKELKLKIEENKIKRSEDFQSHLYNCIIERSFTKINFDDQIRDLQVLNTFVGSKSVLYWILGNTSDQKVISKILTCTKINPWIRNVDDKKLPLHAALTLGNVYTVELLIKSMTKTVGKKEIDLRPYTFRLFQAIMCNISSKNQENVHLNHIKCLEILLSKTLLDFNQNGNDEKCTVARLAKWIGNPDVMNLLKSRVDFEGESTIHEAPCLSWKRVLDILAEDKRDNLELIVAGQGNTIENIFRFPEVSDFQTILHAAVQNKAPKCLKFLLSKASVRQINEPDINGNTPLHYSCMKTAEEKKPANVSCLMLLLHFGAWINARDNDGNTPLHLLAILAINDNKKKLDGLSICINTLLQEQSIFTKAINKQQLTAKEISETNPKSTNVQKLFFNKEMKKQDVHEEIMSHLITCHKRDDVSTNIENLVMHHKSSKTLENRFIGNKTLLYVIAENFNAGIVQHLLDAGLDPWMRNVGDFKIPLHAALAKQDFDMVNHLIKAMEKQRSNATKKLSEYSFSLMQTFLCSLNLNDSIDEPKKILKSLIKMLKGSINMALKEDPVTRQCVSRFTSPMGDHLPDITPMVIATWIKNEDIIEVLQDMGATVLKPDPTIESSFSYDLATNIMTSDSRFHLEIEMARHGGKLNNILRPANSISRQSLFHVAVTHGAVECLKFLLIKKTEKVQLETPDEDGRTPLHYCVELVCKKNTADHLMCLKLLLVGGASVYARDKNGDTSLHNVLQLLHGHIIANNPNDFAEQHFKRYVEILTSYASDASDARNEIHQTPKDLLRFIKQANTYINGNDDNFPIDLPPNSTRDIEAQLLNELIDHKMILRTNNMQLSYIPKYVGAKSVLYHIVATKHTKTIIDILKLDVNPWIKNVDDGLLPLHAALRRGSLQVTSKLLEKMKDTIKPSGSGVRDWSFSLMKTIICNAHIDENNETGDIDHLKCFMALMKYKDYIFLDVDAKCPENVNITPMSLCKYSKLIKFNNILRGYSAKIATENTTGPTVISWSEVLDLVNQDNREKLEIEWALRGGNLEYLHRPTSSPQRMTLLHAVLEKGARNCFEYLVTKMTVEELNEPDEQGRAPLHYAASLKCMNTKHEATDCTYDCIYSSNAPHFLKTLLDSGVFVNTRDIKGNTPLHILVKQAKKLTFYKTDIVLKCIDVLLNVPETDIDAINQKGKTPLNLIVDKIGEHPDSISQVCRKLYEKGAHSRTGLKTALRFKLIQTDKIQHRTGRSLDNNVQQPESRKRRQGFSELLHYIMSKNEVRTKMFLKKHKKHMHLWDNQYISDKYFLFYIIENFDKEVVECCLCFGANCFKIDAEGNLPLHCALQKGDYMICHLLVEYMKLQTNSDTLNVKNRSFSLFDATLKNVNKKNNKKIEIDYHKCLQRLLEKDVLIDKDQPKEDDTSLTPIKLAAKNGDLDSLHILLEKITFNWDDIEEKLSNDDEAELNALIQKGGDRLEFLMRPNGAPSNKWTILHAALDFAIVEDKKGFELLMNKLRTSDAAVSGKLLNEPDADGETVLHKAAVSLAHRVVDQLVRMGADVNARDNIGQTPLHKLKQETKSRNIYSEAWRETANKLLAAADIDVHAKDAFDNPALNKQNLNVTDLREKVENLEQQKQPLMSKLKELILASNKAGIYELMVSESGRKIIMKSQYIGSQSILHCLIDFSDLDIIKKFIDFGCDPWQNNVDGELPLQFALTKGKSEIANALIEKMKEKSGKTYVDLTSHSFCYIKTLLAPESGFDIELSNWNKCLERLMRDDVLIDVNASEAKVTLMQIAATVSNQEAMKYLLTKGAFIGVKRNLTDGETRGILDAIVPEIIEQTMDNCVSVCHNNSYSVTDVTHPEFALKLNYNFLLKPRNTAKSTINGPNLTSYRVANTVLELSGHSNHQNSIQHPLMEALLDYKWSSLKALIIANAVSVYVFLFLLFLQCIFLNLYTSDPFSTIDENVIWIMNIPITIFMIFLFFREMLELYTSKTSYFRRAENYFEWYLMASSLVICYVHMSQTSIQHITAWTILVIFYEFLLTGEHVINGTYIGMFRFTVRNIRRYFLWFLIPMTAFSISLWILYSLTKESSSYTLHITKVFAMAVGDFEEFLNNGDLEQDNLVSMSILFYFLVFYVMILFSQMILITALTISDVGEFTQKVQFHTKQSKWKVVHRYEQMIYTIIKIRNKFPQFFVTSYIDRFLRTFQLPNKKKPIIILKLNEQNPKKRVILGDGVHEYERPMTDKLAAKFRKIYLKKLSNSGLLREETHEVQMQEKKNQQIPTVTLGNDVEESHS